MKKKSRKDTFKKLIARIKHEICTFFKKDNLEFAVKTSTGLITFIASDGWLINLGSKMDWKAFLLLLASIASFSYFLLQIYKRYRYYSSVFNELKSTDYPAYLVCTYLASRKAGLKVNTKNHFNIERVEVTYQIELPNPKRCDNCKLSIHYSFQHATATKGVRGIFFTTLSSNNTKTDISNKKFTPRFRISMNDKDEIDKLNYVHMSLYTEGYKSPHLHLWNSPTVGDDLKVGDVATWEINMEYKNTYDMTKSNKFLIDPSNYCNGSIDELHIAVNLLADEGEIKLIRHPEVFQMNGGLNGLDEHNRPYRLAMKPSQTDTSLPKPRVYRFEKTIKELDSYDNKLFTVIIPPNEKE
ncbi:hypothetical protein [Acutalibacter sp. 1XD8-36]|uniref:hypothetical protein n=1 Tax=Acutalibacter sp. 1XD8-36 TaxID=2320852 RepID=UPI0014121A85|nr:hypothetical protein [Acutalibacter sp. 1XD8-36]NBJ87880.1 hypothetical protein [Acutalibacter sp. 1XD8-36]